jgi:hypothetical protein
VIPTVGRIVHYQSYGTPNAEYVSQARSAVITAVPYGVVNTEGQVSLAVFNPTGLFFNDRVEYSENPKAGCWSWPPLAKAATTPVDTKYVTIPKLPSMAHNVSTCRMCGTGQPCKTFAATDAAVYPHGRSDMDIAGALLYDRLTYIDECRANDIISSLYSNTRKLDALAQFVRSIRGNG